MTTATDLLNSIAAATGTADKNLCISTAVAMLVKAGQPVDAALDAVLGAGTYQRLAGDVWAALRAKAA